MRTPDQIIPLLAHHDTKIRSLALRYLQEAHDPSPATAEDIWKCIDAYGAGPGSENFLALEPLPQTEMSLRRTLESLKREPQINIREKLERVIRRLKSGMLRRNIDLIEQVPNLSEELRDHLQRRVELAALPAAELWDRLIELGKQFGDQSKRDSEQIWRLKEALSHSPEAAGWAISTLNDESITDWREVFAVDVLAELRFRPAADLVLQKLAEEEDADAMAESCVEMLVRTASPQIVESIQHQFPAWELGTRISAAEFCRRVKLPQSETAAFSLLQNEASIEVRTSLAWALCELATTHGPAIDLLVKMVSSGNFDSSILDLDEDVATICAIAGRPRPVLPREAKRSRNPFAAAVGQKLAFHDDAEEPAAAPSLPISFDQPEPPPVPRPMRRQGPKVGRNDPCPCGSGKKYKKCCGK